MTPIPSFPLNGEGEWNVFMKQETEKSRDEQRRIVAYLDGLPLSGICDRGRLLSGSLVYERFIG